MFKILQKFWEKHGHTSPQVGPNGQDGLLASWVHEQRCFFASMEKKATTEDTERFAMLHSIDFFSTRGITTSTTKIRSVVSPPPSTLLSGGGDSPKQSKELSLQTNANLGDGHGASLVDGNPKNIVQFNDQGICTDKQIRSCNGCLSPATSSTLANSQLSTTNVKRMRKIRVSFDDSSFLPFGDAVPAMERLPQPTKKRRVVSLDNEKELQTEDENRPHASNLQPLPSMDCTDWLFWRTKHHSYTRCQAHDKGVCLLGSKCKSGHVYNVHCQHHKLTCEPPTMQKQIEIMRARNIRGEYFYSAGYIDRTNTFVYSQGGSCRLFPETQFPETGIFWYETKDQAISALLNLFGKDAAENFKVNQSRVPLLNPKWLFGHLRPKANQACPFFSTGLACLDGNRCRLAHVLDTSEVQPLTKIFFDDGRIRVVTKISDGKQWFTSGFTCGSFVANVQGGENAVVCPKTGLFWYQTKKQARNALLELLRSMGSISGLP